ncbi:MAG: hypothetical protein WA751_09980 [Candidatus Dormiibacterota bacterium]
MKCLSSCLVGLLIGLALGAVVGGVTWATNSCTMQVGGHNANITLQGWASEATCTQVETSNVNRLAGLVGDVTDGLLSVSWRAGTPGGDVICSGWKGFTNYTVRDFGVTGLDVIGHALCSDLQASAEGG